MACQCDACRFSGEVKGALVVRCYKQTYAVQRLIKANAVRCLKFKPVHEPRQWGCLQADPGYIVRGRRDIEEKGIRRP